MLKSRKRVFKHWTPHYLVNRTLEYFYRKIHPEYPWLTQTANQILSSYIHESDVGLEFGSGMSTLWLARRVGHLTSVEHDWRWYYKIKYKIEEKGLTNVRYLFLEKDRPEDRGDEAKYVKVVRDFKQNSLDFSLVDGVYRDSCANTITEKLRHGGILIIDNANWFLPCKSGSPNSRKVSQGPATSKWAKFLKTVKNWRCIWTTNGVTDTAIYIKPCS
jgi:predicted O-methyltransferase YrrM